MTIILTTSADPRVYALNKDIYYKIIMPRLYEMREGELIIREQPKRRRLRDEVAADAMIGRRFGSLTVTAATNERKSRYTVWECTCDCGNVVYINTRDLKRGHELSCGCMPKKYPHKRGRIVEDLTGQTFERLTVLERCGHKSGRVAWKCLCSCGNTCEVTAAQLKSGKTRSCGCMRRESEHNRKDLTGMKIGRLTPLYPLQERNYKGSILWHCRCECGNEVDLSENALLHGNYVSCGCRRKELQEQLMERLTFMDGTCIEWLRNRKGRSDNTSGFRGVNKRKNGKYRVEIGFKGTRYSLGVYQDFENAVRARRNAEQVIHEEYCIRYDAWLEKAQEAALQGDLNWMQENPLLFEVRKAGIGKLQIETEEGISIFTY